MKTVVSLFSGCGGLDLGFKELGFNLIYACDNDASAVDCYSRNIGSHIFLRDTVSNEFHADISAIGQCDVVLGGFPCQGFSKAGPKNVNDERNILYMEMKRAVTTLRPQLFIAENVDGISQNFSGIYLKRIIEDFKQINYDVEYRILDASWFGVPQHRRRIFFIGMRRSAANKKFAWPSETNPVKIRNGESRISQRVSLNTSYLWEIGDNSIVRSSVKPGKVGTIRDAIGDLVQLDSNIPDHLVTNKWPKKYEAVFRTIKEGQKLCNVRHAATSIHTWQIPEVFGVVTDREHRILETIAKHRRHKKYGDIPNGNPLSLNEIETLSDLTDIQSEIEYLLSKDYLKIKDGKYDLKGAMFCSGIFKRPRWGEPSPTILTNFHNPRYFLHPSENRPFTLRECARLQGFPDTFIFMSSTSQVSLVDGYRLVGNAVPPPLSRLFAAAALQFLTQNQYQAVAL